MHVISQIAQNAIEPVLPGRVAQVTAAHSEISPRKTLVMCCSVFYFVFIYMTFEKKSNMPQVRAGFSKLSLFTYKYMYTYILYMYTYLSVYTYMFSTYSTINSM